MRNELLTPEEMAEADRLTVAAGPFDGYRLMRNAGAAVTAEILARFPDASNAHVLCGPGNNGGDGYVVARRLHELGWLVTVWCGHPPKPGSDAALAAAECPLEPRPLADFEPECNALVVDALFGAGLAKPVAGEPAAAIAKLSAAAARVVSVDLPSGISGSSGAIAEGGGGARGAAVRADVTVTFFRKKPGHLLYPGRAYCGDVLVADIGIRDDVLETIRSTCFENRPSLWLDWLPVPSPEAHKYVRGHVAVFSGGPSATGAARLAAVGAARAGAGAVTLLSPGGALQVNAAHVTAIMLRRIDSVEDFTEFRDRRKPSAYVLGPGFGVGEIARVLTLAALAPERENAPPGIGRGGLVLDADGITSFRDVPDELFQAAGRPGAQPLVLTPHEGEFRRLFPDLVENNSLSKPDRARAAAERASAVVIYKGPDTVIASPDGRAAINGNGTPWLATAGSGDVLAGICAGLLAQGMPAFEAACAAVWIHAEAASRFGSGLIAEDLPTAIVPILRQLLGEK
jgi:hydroxyethylthiazole kinase-like uncharacterized protein yjeF